MPWSDIIIILIIAGFGYAGYWFGFVQSIGSLLGTVIGIIFAFRDYHVIAGWITNHTGVSGNWLNVAIFVLLFVITSHAVGLIFTLINRVLDLITTIPIIDSVNSVLGFVFGMFQGIIIVGISLYFISRFPLHPKIMEAIQVSKIAPFLDAFIYVFKPLIPDAVKSIKSTLEGLF